MKVIKFLAEFYVEGSGQQRTLIHEEKGNFSRVGTTMVHLSKILQRVYDT